LTSSSANIRPKVTIDGNEAAAYVAHQTNEVIAIYPITPSSNMGEWADQWSAEQKINIWGTVPTVIEMQSEGGAAGALHGALQTGSLGTTFTASQGLLLMIPNMFKIAGELTSSVIHVAARALATHALSIFGDHSDVMAVRATGFAMLSANSVQETMDMALIAQAATLEARIPFIHFFDGFRTSHEVAKVEQLTTADMRAMIDEDLVRAHRERGLNPNRPGDARHGAESRRLLPGAGSLQSVLSGHPDHRAEHHGQVRQDRGPAIPPVRLRGRAGCRTHHYYDGLGRGSGRGTVDALVARGEKIGLLKVRLFRPFAVETFVAAIPASVKSIAVLDRTKEPGATGEPLYCDVVTALSEMGVGKKVIGGRYGLASKEFTPAMVKAVFDELLKKSPKNHFTVGIHDDVTHTSLDFDPEFSTEVPGTVRALFYGLGADGTVGANKNSIKIIGEETDNFAQGYFVYDSKKSGAMTTSHLRFGPKPLHSSYLITKASFVACHQFSFLERFDVLKPAEPGATFLLNSTFGADEVWDHLPRQVQRQIIDKKLKFYVIDGYEVAKKTGMGGRVNTIMQTCFFAISGVLPRNEAIEAIKHSIEKTYGKRGESVVKKNFAAVDAALEHLHEVKVPGKVTAAVRHPAGSTRGRPELRAESHRQDHRRRGRRPAGERHAHRRHLPHGYRAVGKAQYRAGNPRMGPGSVHSVRQVRAGLPA
jgi:pyruvate-ferredoxin/flavodoxin oxidoreductase